LFVGHRKRTLNLMLIIYYLYIELFY